MDLKTMDWSLVKRFASPDGARELVLENVGEIRFGPPYYSLALLGRSVPSRFFGNAVKWSNDSRIVAVQEWLSMMEAEGPKTKLVLIDAVTFKETDIVVVDGGFVEPIALSGGKVRSIAHYFGEGREVIFEHEIPDEDAWRPLLFAGVLESDTLNTGGTPMTLPYRHSQIGYVLIGSLSAGAVGLAASIALGSAPKALLAVMVVLTACLLLFPSLTAVVQKDHVQCSFGIGLIRKQIPMAEIASASVVRNRWIYGWGIRLIPGGWMWNVSGLDAVELKLRNGKLFRIGTDEPQALHAAISGALRNG